MVDCCPSETRLTHPHGGVGRDGRLLRLYRDEVEGQARKLIVVHLIVTPEYIRNITSSFPEAVIYAIRLDRGLSPAPILKTQPGSDWDAEVGLNNQQYIVPGGGGFGEVMNNAWI